MNKTEFNTSDNDGMQVLRTGSDMLSIVSSVSNSVIAFLGFISVLTLFAKNSRQYADKMHHGIRATQAQTWFASLIFALVYLPCITTSLLGAGIADMTSVCSLLMWVYGSMHGTLLMLNCTLSVCWMIRILWPNFNLQLYQPTLYVMITMCWVTPTIAIGIDVAMNLGRYPYVSQYLCMHDLDSLEYTTTFLMVSVLVSLMCYTVALVSVRQWRMLLHELSPNLASTVTLVPKVAAAVHADCMANFVFSTLYMVYRLLYFSLPAYRLYSASVLNISFITVTIIPAMTEDRLLDSVWAPGVIVCRRFCCRKRPSQSPATQLAPPSYADVMNSPSAVSVSQARAEPAAPPEDTDGDGVDNSNPASQPSPEIAIFTIEIEGDVVDQTLRDAQAECDEMNPQSSTETESTYNAGANRDSDAAGEGEATPEPTYYNADAVNDPSPTDMETDVVLNVSYGEVSGAERRPEVIVPVSVSYY